MAQDRSYIRWGRVARTPPALHGLTGAAPRGAALRGVSPTSAQHIPVYFLPYHTRPVHALAAYAKDGVYRRQGAASIVGRYGRASGTVKQRQSDGLNR